MCQRNELFVLNTKHYFWGKSNTTHHGVPLFIFSSMVVAASFYGYACHRQGLGSRQGLKIKINGIQLRTGKILEESLVQSAFQQTLGDEFTFQQDNNLKHKAKYTLELLTKTTLNVPEWPSEYMELDCDDTDE